MQPYQAEFIEFLVRSGALTFGDFVTKSGRRTPFFINTGRFDTGEKMRRLGRCYAAALRDRLGAEFDGLYGPAYKGIPLAVATAVALAEHYQQDVGVAFNRKEAKDHGEGGWLIGRKPAPGDRLVIIEDVTTAGTSVRESMDLLGQLGALRVVGLVVAVDRQERGTTDRSALGELRATFGLNAFAIVTLDDIVQHLHNRPVQGEVVLNDELAARIEAYRAQYGVRD
jgi:orotate phosphoribosyltransferase